jgi:acetyl esterase
MTERSFRAHAMRRALRAFFSAPEPILRPMLGKLPRNDRGHELDPGIGAFLRTVASRRRPPHERGLAAMRDEMNQRAPLADFERHSLHRVRDLRVPSGDHAIGVRVYEPPPRSVPRPICVYYHGGGFVVGSVRSHDGLCSRIAQRADCVVVSVDYRLAPEHPFPVPAHDAIAAYRWTVAHAAELGGEPAGVSVAGDSAGANLSAVVAWHERASAHAPRFQMLVYPATDYSRPYDSHHRFASGFLLDAVSMRWFRSHYFGPNGVGRDHPMASVLHAPDLRGVARAHIVTAGFDPLRDEGERYAERLAVDGVDVELVCEERLVHGFFSLGGILESARRAVDRAIAALGSGIRR